MTAGLDVIAEAASEEAVRLARSILEQDVRDRAWSAQLGPVLSQRDTARLLGKSEQAVSADRRLLRLRGGDGRPVYPVMQFRGRRQVEGVARITAILAQAVQPLTIASWLTGAHDGLGGRRPIDALEEGDEEAVLGIAERLAARLDH